MEKDEPEFQPIPVAVAAAMWALLTFGHKVGLDLAGKLFRWAQQPGSLTEKGGPDGQAAIERLLGVVFLALAAAVITRVALLVRKARPDRGELAQAIVPWVAWAAALYLVRKVYIVYATEFVHFGQYAVVGYLVNRAVAGGRRPQLAFLITVASGFVDELWQHYVLASDKPEHFMDWSDLVLDGLGACVGVLPAVTLARLGVGPSPVADLPDDRTVVRRALLVSAALLLPLLLLDPVTQSWALGHYYYQPFWGEFDNDKPTHWPGPREGVPLALAGTFILATLLDPRGRGVRTAGLLALLVLLGIAVVPPSRHAGTPVHEVVPTVVAAQVAAGAITIDGRLDEPAWTGAGRTEPFLDTVKASPATGGTTRARVLWDPAPTGGLYVAYEVEDRDVWARDTFRDDINLPGDEVVELFLDDGGDEVTYYEVEVSPKNTVYDLFCLIPQGPVEYDPDTDFLCFPSWSALPIGPARGLETAVVVDGTLDVTPSGPTPRPQDADRGWTCELFLPWSVLRSPVHPSRPLAFRPIPPEAGQRWRMNLFRVERPRPTAEGGAALPPEFQAWSPTRHPSFHKVSRFGVIEFGGP